MRRPLLSRTLLSAFAVLCLSAAGVAAAFADPQTTTTAITTTVLPSTTTTATTTTTPTTVGTTVATTTTTATAPATTAATTTTAPIRTRSAPRRARPPGPVSKATPLSLARGCAATGLLILVPHGLPLAVGAVASGAAASSRIVYRADGALATAASVRVADAGCTREDAELRSVSLFGGEVTASTIVLRAGAHATATVAGLRVGTRQLPARAGARVPLPPWGELFVKPHRPVSTAGGGRATAVLAIHLLRAHDGLPAGSWLLVAAAAAPQRAEAAPKRPAEKHAARHRRRPSHRHRARKAGGAPLKVTPPLADRRYVFPVAGPSDFVDSYGGYRGDVPGNWHHGDDIFAPLGTPVVAVADGTLNRVGWEKLGGWRLWVRDAAGDEFYYAHLSGYAPGDLHSDRVKAGEVIGFIGNTGDAFTTSPHLHFEIHPRPLLHLGYNGAVDPTGYLDRWTHLATVQVPRPTHPPLPQQPLIRREATFVFRELLAARHLIRRAPKLDRRPRVTIPVDANGPPVARTPAAPPRRAAIAASAAHSGGMSTATVASLAALAALGILSMLLVPRERLRAFIRRARARSSAV